MHKWRVISSPSLTTSAQQSVRRGSSRSDGHTSILFFLMTRRPPRCSLFPYTTLFRSMENRPTTASMIRLARVFGFDLSGCIVRVLREFVMHVHRGLLQALVRANVGVLSQRMHGSGSKRIHREPPSATPNAFKKPI